MPGYSWGISARRCITGAILARVPGSTCSKCYALKGNYIFPNVAHAHKRRLDAYNENPREWSARMAELIGALECRHFRFFDSGDLQSLEMLERILWICANVPRCKFWIVTREIGIVRRYVADGKRIPENAVIRISAPMIDRHFIAADLADVPGIAFSAVHSRTFKGPREGFKTCPSPRQEGKCGDCRACWKRGNLVAYTQH